MPRSSVPGRLKFVMTQISLIGGLLGARTEFSSSYPAWAYNPCSQLRSTAADLYSAMYGKEPVISAIHGGLECGILLDKIPGLDIISFGPDTWDLHTPDEHLSISSTARVWAFLLELLKKL